MTRPEGRLESIHLLRGAAALLVAVAHIGISMADYRFPPVIDVFRHSGILGIGVFFMISGMVVPWSLAGREYGLTRFPAFIARRLVRLDPPYLITAAAALGIYAHWTLRDGTPFPFTWQDVVLHLGYVSGITGHRWVVGVFWTLGVEFQFYLLIGVLFPWIEHAMRRGRDTGYWLVALTSTTGALAFLPHWGREWWTEWSTFFLLGFVLLLIRRGHVHWIVLPLQSALIALWFPTYPAFMWPVLGASAAFILIAPPTFTRWRALLRVPLALGTISYSLYLVHSLTQGKITSMAVTRGWTATPAGGIATALAELALNLGVATALYFAFEAPFHRLSRRITI